MIDLCTVTNHNYINNAIALVDSYRYHNYCGKIYLYYFDIPITIINKYRNEFNKINFLPVPKICSYAYDPKVFFYKTYALNDCITNHSQFFLYSDATNIFNSHVEDIYNYFNNDLLILPYTHPILINKYWTTQKCLLKMQADSKICNDHQYWAGFQGYKSSEPTKKLLSLLYEKMFDPDIALPPANIRYPDGPNTECIEHRQDQSVLSILINQLGLNSEYNHIKQLLFGDYQTFQLFDTDYQNNLNINRCILSRHTKF